MMYFGTKERMAWVKAPAPGAGFGARGFSDSLQYMNGGIGFRNSVNSHMEYDMSWNSLTRDEVAAIENYAYGLYGDGLVYFLDPVAMDRNLFNPGWAAPKIGAEDGIPIAGTVRPAKVLVGDVSLGYPLYGAQYATTTTMPKREFYCPIPTGYTAWIGCSGIVSARGLSVTPMLGTTVAGTSNSVAVTAVNDPTRFTNSIDGTATVNGISISLDTTAAGNITIAGMMLQVLPTGETPAQGNFISGRGNSGCVFDGKLNIQPYSIPGESIGMAAKLIEVGDWV